MSNNNVKPNSKDFLILWKQFNDMAKAHGVTEAALNSKPDHHWSFYYLYGNNYEAVGQTLLEHCISQGLVDTVCSMENTPFGMTAYLLEPKRDEHKGEDGIPRQAADEVIHFSDVTDMEELEETLEEMIEAEGSLKVIAAFPPVDKEQAEFKQEVKRVMASTLSEEGQETDEAEYILLLPTVDRRDITWEYMVFDNKGELLQEGRQE